MFVSYDPRFLDEHVSIGSLDKLYKSFFLSRVVFSHYKHYSLHILDDDLFSFFYVLF